MKYLLVIGLLFASCGQLQSFQKTTLPKGSISGRVLHGDQPLAGIEIVTDTSPLEKGIPSVTSNEKGEFRIPELPPGGYRLHAQSLAYAQTDADVGGGRTFQLGPGENITGIEFTMNKAGIIAGRVIDRDGNPLVDELISVRSVAKDRQPWPPHHPTQVPQTDKNGNYRIQGIPPGRYVVSVGEGQESRYQRTDFGNGYYALVYHPNTPEMSKAGVVEVTPGGETTGIDIVTGPRLKAYTIAGRIIDAATEQPQPGIKYGYSKDAMSTFGQKSDEKGEFRIAGLLPGQYTVFAGCEGDYIAERIGFEIKDRDVTDLVIRRKPGAGLRGKLIADGSMPLSDLIKQGQVHLFTRGAGEAVNAQIEPDGSFHFCGLPPGTVRLEISPWFQKGVWLRRVERNGVDLRNGIEIAAGSQISDVRVFLAYGTGSIQGQLRFTNYQMPPGLRMQIYARRVGDKDRPPHLVSETDDRGQFSFTGLVPGEYELSQGAFVYQMGDYRLPALDWKGERVTVSGEKATIVTLNLTVLN